MASPPLTSLPPSIVSIGTKHGIVQWNDLNATLLNEKGLDSNKIDQQTTAQANDTKNGENQKENKNEKHVDLYRLEYGPTNIKNKNVMSLTTIIIETSEHRHRLQSLLPGTEYKLRISAHNRAGWSAWSSIATVRTKSDVPNRPNAPKVISSKPGTIALTWETPVVNNGSDIIKYQLIARLAEGTVVKRHLIRKKIIKPMRKKEADMLLALQENEKEKAIEKVNAVLDVEEKKNEKNGEPEKNESEKNGDDESSATKKEEVKNKINEMKPLNVLLPTATSLTPSSPVSTITNSTTSSLSENGSSSSSTSSKSVDGSKNNSSNNNNNNNNNDGNAIVISDLWEDIEVETIDQDVMQVLSKGFKVYEGPPQKPKNECVISDLGPGMTFQLCKYSSEGAAREWSTVVIVIVIFISRLLF